MSSRGYDPKRFSKNYRGKSKDPMRFRISELIKALEKVKEKEGDLYLAYYNRFDDEYKTFDEVKTEFWDEPHNQCRACILM